MIDLVQLRENPAKVADLLRRKEPRFDVDKLIALDHEVRALKTIIEQLRKERNDLSNQAKGGVTDAIRARSIEVGRELKAKEEAQAPLEAAFETLLLSCPNIPQDDIPLGDKEANKVVRSFGEKPEFDFPFKNHVELNDALHWFDFETAAKMAGSQFVLYRGDAVKMMYALTRLMIKNNVKYGFEPIMPPYLLNEQSLVNASNFPKFVDQVYSVPEDKLFLLPTAEVPITNIHAHSILSASDLPRRYTSWTSCFRREAGSYGAQERGLIRIHQFEKVEIYTLCEPEQAADELERMVSCAEELLKSLNIHYQVSLLAAQDCSFASARTYDIEVWLPGQNRYYEVSSASNCTDFQARRAAIRYRKDAQSKPEYLYTLNASSLALPRLMVAIMENNQNPDGSINIPKVLADEMAALW